MINITEHRREGEKEEKKEGHEKQGLDLPQAPPLLLGREEGMERFHVCMAVPKIWCDQSDYSFGHVKCT